MAALNSRLDAAYELEQTALEYERAAAKRKQLAVEIVKVHRVEKTRAARYAHISRPTLDKWISEGEEQ